MKKIILSTAAFLSSYALLAQLPVSQTPSNKNVVLEEFTGIYCSYCPDGHKIANQIKTANPNDVVLINIHTGGFADPAPGDPDFKTPFGTAIAGQTNLGGYPAGTVNRHAFPGQNQEGSGTAQSRSTWAATSDTILQQSSYANVALQASINAQTREITVDVEVFYTSNGATSNKLNVALLQSNVEGPQSGASSNPSQVLPNGNYRHDHMLRHLLTGQWGDDITTTSQGTLVTKQYTYTIPADLNGVGYDLRNLEIVAFLAEGQQEIITGAEGPITINIPNGVTLVELKSTTNMQLPNNYCDGTVTPEITVKNDSDSTVSSYEVSYKLNNGSPITQIINTPLAGGASQTTSFPSITLSPGENIFEYNVLPIGSYAEYNSLNNKYKRKPIFILPNSAFAQTHQEGFESLSLGAKTPNNAISDNPNEIAAYVVDNSISSSVSQNLGGFGKSSKSFRWGFYSVPTGGSSKIVFEKLDLSQGTGHGIKFNHAYAQYQSEQDKLEVLISTDCGVNWDVVYSKQGTSLKTANPVQARFYPSVTEWKNNYIDLSNYSGQNEVMVAFKGVSNFGNNLYVDDIQILDGVSIGIEENEVINSLSIYPNPSKGLSTLNIDLERTSEVNISIYNSLGELVISNKKHNLSVGKTSLNLDLSNLNNGIYYANISINGKSVVKQVSLIK